MAAPLKPWETTLQNSGQILRNSTLPHSGMRSAPVLPPRPQSLTHSSYAAASPYSGYGSSVGYGGYGATPYRSSMYNGYNSFGSYGGGYGSYGSGYGMGGSMYGMGGGYGPTYGARDDAESRFIQFAEDSSRHTFANFESVVRAFNSMAMMLDNTFFAMTSSFRAVLGVAENFGRLRSMFAHVWQALNIFRLVNWMYRKMMRMAGYNVPSSRKSMAWNEALTGSAGAAGEAAGSGGSSWPTLAFFGVVLSAPYFISKLLPKYEDKLNPDNWKSSGIPAKAAFDFAANASNELSLHTNDDILLAPRHIQEEMKLTNSGWAYATCNGRSGVVPLNYIVVMKRVAGRETQGPVFKEPEMVIPRKTQKRVSFGENQVFEEKDQEVQSVESSSNSVPDVGVVQGGGKKSDGDVDK